MFLTLQLLALAILVIAGYGWALGLLQHTKRRGRYFAPLLIGIMLLQTVVSGLGSENVGLISPENAGLISRGLTRLGAYLGLLSILLCFRPTEIPAQGRLLLGGYLAYLGLSTLAILGSTNPTYPFGLIAAPLIVLGLMSTVWGGGLQLNALLQTIRWGFGAIVVASLSLFMVSPSLASLPYADSLIGVPLRLHGVTPHANTLGPLSAAYLLLLLAPIRHSVWTKWIAVGSLATLLLSQSKTSLAALLFAGALFVFFRIRGQGIRAWSGRILSLGALLGALLFVTPSLQGRVADDSSITTLTGRTQVWEITLAEFEANPTSGYGPHLWDDEFGELWGLEWAGQAHNLYVQTAGLSGWLGLIGLAVLLLTMTISATRSVDSPFFMSLFGLLIIRSFTETPISFLATDLYSGGAWLTWLLLLCSPTFRRPWATYRPQRRVSLR